MAQSSVDSTTTYSGVADANYGEMTALFNFLWHQTLLRHGNSGLTCSCFWVLLRQQYRITVKSYLKKSL